MIVSSESYILTRSRKGTNSAGSPFSKVGKNARLLFLANKQRIPYEDISARILTEGLLGSNYVSIVPGFDGAPDHPYLRAGDVIEKTQEAVILENVIGQLLFNIKTS